MSSEDEFTGGPTAHIPPEDLKEYSLDERVPTLIVMQGINTGLRIPLIKEEIVLGRTEDADVVLHDDRISRRHAVIRSDPEQMIYTLSDLKSTNGTRVNLRQITEVELHEGDKIFLGSTVIKFVLQDEVDSEHARVVSRWAFTDDLTGLVVRRGFYNQLRFQIKKALERSEKLALLMLDMDGLKKVNDTHGHQYGGFVISQVGRLLGEICNPLGLACRYGGDEFVVFLVGHDLEAAMQVGKQIRATVQVSDFEKDNNVLKVTISIGVAVLPDHAQDLETLNTRADEALYRAKEKGRNCVSD